MRAPAAGTTSPFLRRHAVALLALFVALGGTSSAATGFPANVIGAKQLKRNAVTTPKLKNRAITGSKIARNALSGAGVREVGLGQVPTAAHTDSATNSTTAANAITASNAVKATHATSAVDAINATNATTASSAANAGQLGGSPPYTFHRRITGKCENEAAIAFFFASGGFACTSRVAPIVNTPGLAHETVALVGGGFSLDIQITCHDSGTTKLVFLNQGGGGAATLSWFYSDGTAVSASGVALAQFATRAFPFAGKRLEGQFIYAKPSGVMTVKLHAFDNGPSGCEVRGTAVAAEST